MKTIMKLDDLRTTFDLQRFLEGSQAVAFAVHDTKDERYRWIEEVLAKFQYHILKKGQRGQVIRFIMKITGYSRQQLTRLIKQYRETGVIKRRQRTVSGFKRKYEECDILLLAQMDERHNNLSGPAIKKLCERACYLFKEKEYERLASISVAHIYNLRKSKQYRRNHCVYTKTKPRASSIGTRRKPQTGGKPGYIRIDTVHQGDLGKVKGVYHINAVDEITQFEVVCTVETISKEHLLPALQMILAAFPFVVLGFHSDNGSEYINKYVAAILEKLLIEFTKSRPRRSNDNALVECKNGAIIRKVFHPKKSPGARALACPSTSQ